MNLAHLEDLVRKFATVWLPTFTCVFVLYWSSSHDVSLYLAHKLTIIADNIPTVKRLWHKPSKGVTWNMGCHISVVLDSHSSQVVIIVQSGLQNFDVLDCTGGTSPQLCPNSTTNQPEKHARSGTFTHNNGYFEINLKNPFSFSRMCQYWEDWLHFTVTGIQQKKGLKQ